MKGTKLFGKLAEGAAAFKAASKIKTLGKLGKVKKIVSKSLKYGDEAAKAFGKKLMDIPLPIMETRQLAGIGNFKFFGKGTLGDYMKVAKAKFSRGGGFIDGAAKKASGVEDFIKGTASFDDVLEDYAKLYAEMVSKNEKWSWNKSILGGENLSIKQKRLIKELALKQGLIPDIKVIPVEGMRYGFADFKGANLVHETVDLPVELWNASDRVQFDWLNKKIGGARPGTTWHHSEFPGKMELVDFGIHNITSHNGGRTAGMWAGSPR